MSWAIFLLERLSSSMCLCIAHDVNKVIEFVVSSSDMQFGKNIGFLGNAWIAWDMVAGPIRVLDGLLKLYPFMIRPGLGFTWTQNCFNLSRDKTRCFLETCLTKFLAIKLESLISSASSNPLFGMCTLALTTSPKCILELTTKWIIREMSPLNIRTHRSCEGAIGWDVAWE